MTCRSERKWQGVCEQHQKSMFPINNMRYGDINLLFKCVVPSALATVIQCAEGGQNLPTYQGGEVGDIFTRSVEADKGPYDGIEAGLLMPPPEVSVPCTPLKLTEGFPQLERRKSVKDLVTEISSCISSVSSREVTQG